MDPGLRQLMTFRIAWTDEIPKYDDGCLEERDKALTSSVTLATMPWKWESRLSLGASGMDCNDSRSSLSGDN